MFLANPAASLRTHPVGAILILVVRRVLIEASNKIERRLTPPMAHEPFRPLRCEGHQLNVRDLLCLRRWLRGTPKFATRRASRSQVGQQDKERAGNG